MVDEKGRFAWERVEFFERNIVSMRNEISKLIALHKETQQHMNAFGLAMQEIAAQEPFLPIQNAINAISQCTLDIQEATHVIVCDQPENDLVPDFDDMRRDAIDPMKKLIKDRDNIIKLEHKLEKEYEGIRNKASKDAQKKHRLLSDQRRRVENANVMVEYHMKKFEEFRVERVKKILQQVCFSQLFYHCRAVENFPVAAKATSEITPEKATQELTQKFTKLDG